RQNTLVNVRHISIGCVSRINTVKRTFQECSMERFPKRAAAVQEAPLAQKDYRLRRIPKILDRRRG
ncbi:MAG: hypothetical protein V1495_07520, partial [Pseudomonadota bacterium]